VKRVLRKDGTCFVNLGDSYASTAGGGVLIPTKEYKQSLPYTEHTRRIKSGEYKQLKTYPVYPKSLCLIPQRFAIEMVNRKWILRNEIIWHKPNCMPSSANDRFTVDFEYLFFFTKNNKAIFWTNGKTLECVDKKPLGTKGIEGIDWEWREVGNYEGTDAFNVKVRDSDKDKFLQKASPSEIAFKYGYDPEGICPICGRTWKRHASPNAKDRKEGIKREFIPCIGNTKIPEDQAESFGSPRARYYRKSKLKKVSLWTGHDYWFEQQFEAWKDTNPNDTKRANGNCPDYQGKWKDDNSNRSRVVGNPVQGRNKRCVWTISTKPFPGAHFAVYPEALIETPIKAGCPEFVCKKCGKGRSKIIISESKPTRPGVKSKDTDNNIYSVNRKRYMPEYKGEYYTDCLCGAGWEGGIVLDPFMGAGTTALVALKQRKRFIGIEIKREYIDMAKKRIKQVQPNLF